MRQCRLGAALATAAFLILAATARAETATAEEENARLLAEDDTVVIEATPRDTELGERRVRSLPWQSNSASSLDAGLCLTSRGEAGDCKTFRECYPYFKVPDLSAFDGWILGVYDTCSYVDPDGRVAYGVCCSNPPVIPGAPSNPDNDPVIEDVQESNKDIANKPRPHYPSWPPPLPTHSPDNTIPPLPTHPPSPGYPGFPGFPGFPAVTKPRPPQSTTTRPGATTWPTKKPGAWWPPTPAPPPKPPVGLKPEPPAAGGGGIQASCGAKNGIQEQERIVGGHSADLGEWPWIAALFNMNRQFCGGSLIDDSHILTAAHCVAQMSSWDVAGLTVRLGDHNIKTNNEVQHVERRVRRIVRHRGFDTRTLYNDVAILTLDKPVPFTEQIRPVCLPSGSQLYSGKTATVIGWGSLRESGPQPAVLQEVSVPVWTNNECRSKYGAAAPGGIIESFLCAGRAAMDSCSGDSGGPLMVNDGTWVQVGIVSWGIGCGKGQYPGVYTRVTHFLPWIHKNLK